jgi:hypothetical protein
MQVSQMQASQTERFKKPGLAMVSRPFTLRVAQPTARTIAYAGTSIKRPSYHGPKVAAALDLA